ncbi:hypothetical protein [Actinomadura sp. GTD37]|uniref:hypothetical protein n=1 Tax=Actinomadura sp. GTD37 TaxID=1778030 RepID=UPI0035BFE4E6
MPPRPEDLAAFGVTPEVSVRLADVEPILGLVAAMARFSAHLTPDAYAAMPEAAQDALGQAQALLWRLERSAPDPPKAQAPAAVHADAQPAREG